MDARDYWTHYVEANGGPVGVAEKLGIPYPTIAGVCNGSRGIGHELCEAMVAADPLLDKNKLIWVRPIKERKDARRTTAANTGDVAEADGTPASLKDAA